MAKTLYKRICWALDRRILGAYYGTIGKGYAGLLITFIMVDEKKGDRLITIVHEACHYLFPEKNEHKIKEITQNFLKKATSRQKKSIQNRFI